MPVYTCLCRFAHICRGQRGVQCLLQSFSHLFYLLIQSLSINLGLSFQSRLASQQTYTSLSLAPNRPPWSCPSVCPTLWIQEHRALPISCTAVRDLSSGPHACTASTLPTDSLIKAHFSKRVFYALEIKPYHVYPYHEEIRTAKANYLLPCGY